MLAYGYAKKYCMEHNLSVDKLMKQRFEITYGSAIFARPSNVKPEGLTTTNGELNRLNTQKILVVKVFIFIKPLIEW